jgi:hypothetical protein
VTRRTTAALDESASMPVLRTSAVRTDVTIETIETCTPNFYRAI